MMEEIIEGEAWHERLARAQGWQRGSGGEVEVDRAGG